MNKSYRRSFALGYSHPSTLVLVDDSESFLRNLELSIPQSALYQTFTDPHRAMEYFNDSDGAGRSLVHRAVNYHGQEGDDPLLRIEMEELDNTVLDPDRFTLPTVLITDYAMPSLNGLELCEAINDPSVKKILLTGEADAQTGLEAFNNGIIDAFIPKQGPLVDQVFTRATSLQSAYFADLQNPFLSSSMITPFFDDRAAIEAMADIKESGRYVEHYLQTNPFGYVLVSAGGEIARVAIFSEEDILEQISVATEYGAPKHVLSKIQARTHLAMFYEHPEDMNGQEEFDWDEYLKPAKIVDGLQEWHFVVDSAAPGYLDYDPSNSSYNAARSRAMQQQ